MDIRVDYAKPKKVLYICDKKACGESCPNEACEYTCDIEHAGNFKLVSDGTYVENDCDDLIARYLDAYKNYRPSMSMTNDKTIGEIVDTMNDEQLTCMYWLIGSALCFDESK